MADDDKDVEPVEAKAEGADEEDTSKDGDEEEKKPKEDPELTALKEEIKSFEVDLKLRRAELSRAQDQAEEYTELGYKRKCAEMDNTTRMRSAASSAMMEVAKANVIKSFLPNLDNLNSLGEDLADVEVFKSYSALITDFEGVLNSMGLAEFSVDEGSKLSENSGRCTVISEEMKDDVDEAGIILSVNKNGYEVSGQVIRKSEVVVSLGKEKEAEEDVDSGSDGEEKVEAVTEE